MIRTDLLSVLMITGVICWGIILPVSASQPQDAIPQTENEIHTYAQQILREEIIRYCQVQYTDAQVSHLSSDQLAEAAENYPEYPRRITDSKNTTITIVHPITRLVAYNSQAIGALDAVDLVVGVANSSLDDAPVLPALETKVNIGGGGPYEPDFEKILSCKPDAILTYTELGPGTDFFEQRVPEGVPVIRLDTIRPKSIVTETNKLGYLLNRTGQAAAYERWHDYWIGEIDRRLATLPADKKVKVFIDIWSDSFTDKNTERRTAGGGQWYSYGMYATDAGGINIAQNISNPQSTVDIEWIAKQNPDVILVVAYEGGLDSENSSILKNAYADLASNPVLNDVSAVKNKRVYVLSYRYTNGLTYPASRARVAKWFYPDLFADIDPSAIHQEYITQFLGSDYNVSRQGAFSYPD